MASLYIVGTGPGAVCHLTDAARQAIAASDVIVGYDSYVELVRTLLTGKQVISTGMMQEVQRCREAISLARAGKSVALVSGGDSGIYGMAGLVLELVDMDSRQNPDLPPLEVQIIPGISAVQAAAALLGAPLMHDFAVISLSDLLTPWDLIKTRLEAAARADFVVAIYNPRSKSRRTQIEEARNILLAYRPADTPAGIVRNACREGETVVVTTLGGLLDHEIDMTSIVLIGNASSFIDAAGRIVTPRGYAAKYAPAAVATESVTEQGPFEKPGAVMFCGTASDVGKSIVTSGFCRCLVKRGMAVAPFKSQNMSLNSYVTPEGGEIGRAQAVQAQACDINPHTDMNPVLLKPNSDTGSQVIVQGKPVGNMSAYEYDAFKPSAFKKIRESFDRLQQAYEFIVIEGAGSISEINLKKNDIANLKIASMARCPVILVADIDRGGVFAQIIGTIELLEPLERSYIKGIIINKFRGDVGILKPGIEFIEQRTGLPVLGVLPWLADMSLPAEDSVVLGQRSKVISIMTAGSKSTIADLYFLMERGLFDAIQEFKGHIAGICGGFQMLGTAVYDPDGVESVIKEAQGLGLLPSSTVLMMEKETHQALAYLDEAGLMVAPECSGVMTGYEIHMGVTTLGKGIHPFSRIFRRGDTSVSIEEGAVSPDGRIFGTYLHGLFENSRFREIYLNRIRLEKGMPLRRGTQKQVQNDPFDQLAEKFEMYLDMPRILAICGLGSDTP